MMTRNDDQMADQTCDDCSGTGVDNYEQTCGECGGGGRARADDSDDDDFRCNES